MNGTGSRPPHPPSKTSGAPPQPPQSHDNNNNNNTGTNPTARHHRQVSAPAVVRDFAITELGRQWSTGGNRTPTTDRQSFVLTQELQQAWGNSNNNNNNNAFSSWLDGSSSSNITMTRASYNRSVSDATSDASSLLLPPPPPPTSSSSLLLAGPTVDPNVVTSVIHDEARVVNWDSVLRLCETVPHNASYVGPEKWTALHHACNRRCGRIDVYKALLQAYPDALLYVEAMGMTPLHYACRFKAPTDAVRLLVDLFPSLGRRAATRRDKKGRTPLWYAVRYEAPAGVMEILLDIDPTAVLAEDSSDDSPLGLVWEDWAEKFDGQKTLQPYLEATKNHNHTTDDDDPTDTASMLRERLKRNKRLDERWTKTLKLLKGAFRFSVMPTKPNGESRTFRVLHATCAIQCHPSLFLFAQSLYPEQLLQHDQYDLYVPDTRRHNSDSDTAALSSTNNNNNEEEKNKKQPPLSCSTNQTALHLAAGSAANGETGRSVIQALLEAYPASAQHADDTHQQMPLHIVAANKAKHHWTLDGAKDIWQAHPNAAQATDHQGQLPLHKAASVLAKHDDHDDLTDCSVLANLLTAYPPGASTADTTGCLPFHLVAQHGQDWYREVQLLLDAHPAVTRTRAGPLHRLPLHMAAANTNASKSLLVHLADLHPRATSQADSNGQVPLHLACAAGRDWDIVSILHQHNTAVIQQQQTDDLYGWNALQMAAHAAQSTISLIGPLVEKCPQAASVADRQGRTALHLACDTDKAWVDGGVERIFAAYPAAIQQETVQGMLPFHVAAMRMARDKDESVETSRRHVELLLELLRADPNILPKSNE